MKQQPIPEAAVEDENSIEMMRVWIAQKKMHTSLNIGIYHGRQNVSEEKAWGILLADAARHVANALQERYGIAKEDALTSIRHSLDTELGLPTSHVGGSFVEKH